MVKKPKRDQRAYELYNRYSFDMLVNTIMEAANELGEPYTIKPCASGKRGYPPKAMVMMVSLCEYWNAGYRRAHSSVKGNRSLLEKLGLATAPSKTTIGNAYQKIPESYFHKRNEIITRRINTGNVARDATGMSDSRKKVWLDVRTGGK